MKFNVSKCLIFCMVLAITFISIQCKDRAAVADPRYAPQDIVREDSKVFIVDRLGERWDVTQAASEGFRAELFQFGVGRDTFVTLDDSMLASDTADTGDTLRIIGIEDDGQAKAYSVSKLSRHEVSNSRLGEAHVAVAY